MNWISNLIGSDSAPAVALLSFAIIMILVGQLVPRIFYKQALAEAARWQAAYEKEREARVVSTDQVGELLEMSKTSNAVLQALFNNQASKQTGDPYVVSSSARD